MGELAEQGKGIIFVSSYLPELMGVCHRIAVMCKGTLCETRAVQEWTEHEILEAAIGARNWDDLFMNRELLMGKLAVFWKWILPRLNASGPFVGLVLVIGLFSLSSEVRPYFLTGGNFKIIFTQMVILKFPPVKNKGGRNHTAERNHRPHTEINATADNDHRHT